MLRFLAPFALTLAALPASALTQEEADALHEALGLPEIIEIMREEGLDYGGTIEGDLFPGRGGDGWDATVSRIYDAEAMNETMRSRLAADLEGVEADPLLDFFESARGKRIVNLEISARRALLDPDVEDAAEVAAAELREDDPERFALLEDFVDVNDLVDSNVMGAMNSNYAFYVGLMEGDAFGDGLTESDILSDVWAQEAEIRADTEDWVYSYLALAYDPLPDEDIEAYVAISGTEEGRALNRALFAAFDELFVSISRRLGYGAAGFMAGQDI